MNDASLAMDDASLARALELLSRIYLPQNRKHHGHHVPSTIDAGELQFLTDHNLKPNSIQQMGHDDVISIMMQQAVPLARAATLYLQSLASSLPHGPWLDASLLATTLPHPHATPHDDNPCHICGVRAHEHVDTTELFLRWHQDGGGLPGSVLWAWYGRRFVPESTSALAAEGRALLSNALLAISGLPAGATAAKAIKACQTATGHGARAAQDIVETLAFAGILEAPPHLGMLSQFVSSRERDARPNMRVEFDAPLGFWRGHHGVNWAHAQLLFGVTHADAQALAAAANPVTPHPKTPNKHTKPRVRSPVARRPATIGDVWAVPVREDAWIAVFVWDAAPAQGTRGKDYALVEYLDWFGTEPTWSSPPVQIRSDAQRARRPMWLHGLHRLTGAWLLAENQPQPQATMPTARWYGGAKDAAQLAVWCFPELG